MLTVGILHRDDLLIRVEIVEQRRENTPAGIQFIVTDEVRMVALEGVEDQGLVGFGDLDVGEAAAVGEVEFGGDGVHAEPRQFRVHLDVDGFVGLDADDEFVAGDVFEDARGDVAELDADFGLLFVEG